MKENGTKTRISKELIKTQHDYIQKRISEAHTPFERAKAVALYLKMLGIDVLISLSMVYDAREKIDSDS